MDCVAPTYHHLTWHCCEPHLRSPAVLILSHLLEIATASQIIQTNAKLLLYPHYHHVPCV